VIHGLNGGLSQPGLMVRAKNVPHGERVVAGVVPCVPFRDARAVFMILPEIFFLVVCLDTVSGIMLIVLANQLGRSGLMHPVAGRNRTA